MASAQTAATPQALREERENIEWLMRAAAMLALLPMATGIAIFILWLLSRWFWLVLVGALTVICGAACVAAGIVFIGAHVVLSWRRRLQGKAMWRSAAVMVLLLANFPVAGAAAWAFKYIETLYSVEVRNDAPSAVDHLTVSGAGIEVVLEHIPPDGSRRTRFHTQFDGSLSYQFRLDGIEHHGVLEAYVSGLGGHLTLLIEPGGRANVSDEDRL